MSSQRDTEAGWKRADVFSAMFAIRCGEIGRGGNRTGAITSYVVVAMIPVVLLVTGPSVWLPILRARFFARTRGLEREIGKHLRVEGELRTRCRYLVTRVKRQKLVLGEHVRELSWLYGISRLMECTSSAKDGCGGGP